MNSSGLKVDVMKNALQFFFSSFGVEIGFSIGLDWIGLLCVSIHTSIRRFISLSHHHRLLLYAVC